MARTGRRDTSMRRAGRRPPTYLRPVLRAVAYAVLVGVVAIAVFVVSVGVRRTQTVSLPPPAGDQRVGRLMFDWTDSSRRDPYAPTPTTARELSVWVWYPAAPDSAAARSAYAPGSWSGLAFSGPAAFLEGPLTNVRPNSFDGPPVARGRFPIVVLEPGMGLAAPEFTALAEGIASEGYLVAGVTPTYSANLAVIAGHPVAATRAGNPPDLGARNPAALDTANHLLTTWAADATFAAGRIRALDHDGLLAGHVSRGPVSYIGHSFGGASALQACDDDPTCAGAVDIDGAQFGQVGRTGLRRPFLILGSENSCVLGSCDPASTDERADLAAAQQFLQSSAGTVYRYSILGTKHFDFTDLAVWYIAPPVRYVFPLGSIDGRRGLEIEVAVVDAFLARIHADESTALDTLTIRYPEVRRLP